MSTDLFLAARKLDPAALAAAVPPACRRPAVAAPPADADGADVVVALPDLVPRHPARRLLPAFALLHDAAVAFRFEIALRRDGTWSPWIAGAPIGAASFAPEPAAVDGARFDVDVLDAEPAADAVRLRLRVPRASAGVLDEARWLLALSAWDGRVGHDAGVAVTARLAVPAASQMEAAPALAHRICSPTSVAMVLGYWGVRAEATALAAETLHPALDLYGVWPAAIAAAARRGIAGYLLRFPDWASVVWCLASGIPIVASVRYGAGELAGAAIHATAGHLLVLTGVDGDDVLVNDPAAPTAATVARRYRLDEFRRVWLERTGIGYVLFPPGR